MFLQNFHYSDKMVDELWKPSFLQPINLMIIMKMFQETIDYILYKT